MKHAEKQCEYEHCIEMFTPKRRDSRYCSASCRNMAGQLRRQEENRQRMEALSGYMQRKVEGEAEEPRAKAHSQPIRTVVQYVTQPSQTERVILQDMRQRMIDLMNKVLEIRNEKEVTALELSEIVRLLKKVSESDLLKYIPRSNPMREFLSPISNEINWWFLECPYKLHNIHTIDEEILEGERVAIKCMDGNFWNWLSIARIRMSAYTVI